MDSSLEQGIQFSNLKWDEKGLPHSVQFDDHYFCTIDGMNESRHVFCGGNVLAERWRRLPAGEPAVFTLAETGFGSGLNLLCAWELWRRHAPENWSLHYISIDQFPFTPDDFIRVSGLWPDLKEYSQNLTQHYSHLLVQPVEFSRDRLRVRLIVQPVVTALESMRHDGIKADAWFLDGFAPSKNPDMWSDEVFHQMSLLSTKGATAATFSSAGFVRRGLTQHGFQMQRAPGFAGKRHMLKGIYRP